MALFRRIEAAGLKVPFGRLFIHSAFSGKRLKDQITVIVAGFIHKGDAKAETPILWSPHVKS